MRRFLSLAFLCILGAMIIGYAGQQLKHYQHPDRTVWMLRAQELNGEPIQTMILGDSQAMSGIRPDLFNADSGRVINMGLPSAQPEALISFIPYLEEHSVDTLIVNISPYSLYHTEVFDAFLNYYRHEFISVRWPSANRMYLYGSSAGEALGTVFSGVGLYRLNSAIRNLATDTNNSFIVQPGPFPGIGYGIPEGEALLKEPSLLEKMRNIRRMNQSIEEILRSTNGFWTWRDFKEPSRSRCDTEELKPLPATLRFKERPEAVQAWQDFLNLASPHVGRIVLIRIPFSKSWHDTVDKILPSAKVSSDIQSILGNLDYPEKVVYLSEGKDFPNSEFYDWNHLDYCGARKYTLFLLEQMQDQKK
ncbi:MAG: hypothetical protein RH862_06570 [Leptospiraceae bacterium]